MKKKIQKLKLSRETVLRLDAIRGGVVSGETCDAGGPCNGDTQAGHVCSQTCLYSCGSVCTFGC